MNAKITIEGKTAIIKGVRRDKMDELIDKLASTYISKDKVEIVYLQNYALVNNKEQNKILSDFSPFSEFIKPSSLSFEDPHGFDLNKSDNSNLSNSKNKSSEIVSPKIGHEHSKNKI